MGTRYYASTRIPGTPIRIGRSFGGGHTPDLTSAGAKRLICWWFVAMFVLFWVVPFVTGIMIGLFPLVFIAAMLLEHRAQRARAREAAGAAQRVAWARDAQRYLTEEDQAWFAANTPEV
jgi:hypothetical protein